MALITCPECGGNVSDTCDVCIHCGYRLKGTKPIKADAPLEGESEADVIAARAPSGGTSWIGVLDIVLGLGFVGLFGIWISNGIGGALWWAKLIVFATLFFGLAVVTAGIIGLVQIGRAGRLVDDCVVYHKEKELVEMTQLGGSKVRIAPKDIIDAKAGFSTDFMLVVIYADRNGMRRKANLGFTVNRPAAVEGILRLKRAKKN